MNGPRTKDEAELAWSAIKRAATARINFDLQVERERRLNEELDRLFKRFRAALGEGKLLTVADALELGGGS